MTEAQAVEAMPARYTSAWCSQDPASVAAYFAESGTLTINAGTPAVGRAAIAASAQSFMSAFPDLVVAMDDLRVDGMTAVYHWTLDEGGRIATSLGHFDEHEYARHLHEDPRRDGGPS